MIISLSVLMCLFCCRCCVAGWRRAIHMKQQLGRLKKLEELESNEKKRRTSHLHTTLDTTDLDIYPSESVSQQHLVGCTTSAITKEDSVDDPVPYSVQKASRARQLLESSRPDTRSVSADTKRGDRQLHTSPSIGNRNSNISGDNLFARVAAKDIKTFSSIVPSAPTADSTKMSSVKRRSFRSEFEFRLKTEVLNGMSETQIKKVESSDDYFSRLEKQLREEESGQD